MATDYLTNLLYIVKYHFLIRNVCLDGVLLRALDLICWLYLSYFFTNHHVSAGQLKLVYHLNLVKEYIFGPFFFFYKLTQVYLMSR